MQGFDEVIRVNLPIDMNKARATKKRRQEKVNSALGRNRGARTEKSQEVPAAPKPSAKVTEKAAESLSNLLFPKGL